MVLLMGGGRGGLGLTCTSGPSGVRKMFQNLSRDYKSEKIIIK